MQKCVLFGSPRTANVTWNNFLESAKFFDPTLNEKVDSELNTMSSGEDWKLFTPLLKVTN